MTGYIRKDTTNNIADGNVINATDLDNEFDGIQAAFVVATGHTHDGTASEGAAITKIGPVQDVVVSIASMYPKITNTVDLGTSSLKYKDAFFAGNETVGGTLAVTGVATLTAQPVLSSLTASQAVFTDASKGLVSNAITGTGNVVMSTSPTLVTPVLGAASATSLTVSGGTANGVTYLNGSKVLTSGTALTFDGTSMGIGTSTATAILSVVGTLGIDTTRNNTANGEAPSYLRMRRSKGSAVGSVTTIASGDWMGALVYEGADGTSFVPGARIHALADGTVGTGSMPTALVFSTTPVSTSTPVERVCINSSGNVGIGTNSPAYKLDVTGSVRISSKLLLDTGTAALPSLTFSGWVDTGIYNPTGTSLGFSTNGAERMRLTSAGNLGIGTTSPAYKLDAQKTSDGIVGYFRRIGATINPAISISANETGNTVGFGTDYAGSVSPAMTFSTQGAERLRIDSSGNLGLGASPSAWASDRRTYQVGRGGAVTSGTGAGFITLSSNAYYDGTSYRYIATDYSMLYGQTTGQHQWSTAASGTAGAAITFTQAMTLDASGNLGIGTTSPLQKLQVNGNIAMSAGFLIPYNGTTPTGYIGYGTALTTAADIAIRCDTGNIVFGFSGTPAATLNSSGNLGLGVTSPLVKLDVAGGSSADVISIRGRTSDNFGLLSFATSAGTKNAYLGSTDSTNLVFYTNGFNERMRLNVNGYLGIGTDNPDSVLMVNKTGVSAGLRIGFTGASQNFYDADVQFFRNGAGSERMRIDASGNLLVGTTATNAALTQGVTAVIGSGASKIHIGHVNGTGDGSTYAVFSYNGTAIGTITQSLTSAVAYNTSSDYRLKNITGPITTSGAYIDSLKPVEGTWKADGSTFVGLIAHETQEASRTPVATGTKDGEQMQGMDYSSAEIIANLIAELQSVRTRLAALEAK